MHFCDCIKCSKLFSVNLNSSTWRPFQLACNPKKSWPMTNKRVNIISVDLGVQWWCCGCHERARLRGDRHRQAVRYPGPDRVDKLPQSLPDGPNSVCWTTRSCNRHTNCFPKAEIQVIVEKTLNISQENRKIILIKSKHSIWSSLMWEYRGCYIHKPQEHLF